MTTIGVTGVGGFIGRRIARRALQNGWEVRGLDLDEQAVVRLSQSGVKAVAGDVANRAVLAEFSEGLDIVVHTAAVVDESGPAKRFRRVNVEGTRNVLEAAANSGVERLVHLSSVMVYGFEYPQEVNEAWTPPPLQNIYCCTKRESDLLAREAHRQGGLETIVIRPGDVYGAASRPWVLRPLEMMGSGLFSLPAKGQGVINHVHVDNLVDAIFEALSQGATGEVYNVTDGQTTVASDFFSYHATWLSKKRVPTVPTAVLKTFLKTIGPGCRLFGIQPPATPEAIDFLLRRERVSSAKIHGELGWTPKFDLAAGMVEVERELKEAGVID